MKRLLVFVLITVLTLSLNPKQPPAPEDLTLNRIAVVESSLEDAFFMPTFRLSDVQIELAYENGTTERIALCLSMLSIADQEKLNSQGQHTLTVHYETFEIPIELTLFDETQFLKDILIAWLESAKHTLLAWDDIGVFVPSPDAQTPDYLWRFEDLKGAPGSPADPPQLKFEDNTLWWWDTTDWNALMTFWEDFDPERWNPHLRMEATMLQWLNGDSWETLIDFQDLQGTPGITGPAGHSPALRVDNDILQWFDGETWQDLVTLATFKGDAGAQGVTGPAGHSPALRVENEILQWFDGASWQDLATLATFEGEPGVQGDSGVTGPAGHSPALRVDNDILQWFDGETWQDLVMLDTLKGEPGVQGDSGVSGPAGHSPALRVENEILQWFDGETWQDLVTLDTFKGETGAQGDSGVTGPAGHSPALRVDNDILQWFDGHVWQDLMEIPTLHHASWPTISVRFIDDQNALIEQRWHDPNELLIPPHPPHKEHKVFSHWQGLSDLITEASIIQAVYNTVYHDVRFYDEHHDYIQTLSITSGAFLPWVTYEAAPGFSFKGWSLTAPSQNTVYFSPNKIDQALTLYAWVEAPTNRLEFHRVEDGFHTQGFILNPGEQVKTMTVGYHHGLLVTSDQRILMWGSQTPNPGAFVPPHDITAKFDLTPGKAFTLHSGAYHSALLTEDGDLWLWGYTSANETLHAEDEDATVPHRVESWFDLEALDRIVAVALAPHRTTVLTLQGRLFVWGSNQDGVLGTGDSIDLSVPQEIFPSLAAQDDRIVSVRSSASHQGFLTEAGHLYLFGSNRFGQVFPGLDRSISDPIALNHRLPLEEDETIVEFAVGWRHTGVLTSHGRLLTWGDNSQGQLGLGNTTRTSDVHEITPAMDVTFKALQMGPFMSVIQDEDGRVYAWGTLPNTTPFLPPVWQALAPEALTMTAAEVTLGLQHFSYLSEGDAYSMGSNPHLHGFDLDVVPAFERSHVYSSVMVYQSWHSFGATMPRFDLLYPDVYWFQGSSFNTPWMGGTMPAHDVIVYGYIED